MSTPSLSYPDTTHPLLANRIPFQQPTQLLSFSYDTSHALEFTDSALRYFVDPPIGANLNHGYERWIWKSDERGRIDSLLRAFAKAKEAASSPFLENIGVVSWRGVMTKILISPYEERDGWEMNVMFVQGTMYFEEHFTDDRLREMQNMNPKQRRQTYYGYAFESYCTSDSPTRQSRPTSPDTPMGWSGDVNNNVQWCSVVRTKLGNTRIVIGGEVDCIRGHEKPETNAFVELKTSLAIRNRQDEARFEKKLLKFYFQSFLLGVPEILVGFRTPAGILTTTQLFKTMEMPRLVRGKPGAWDPQVCLDWGNRFFCFLKTLVEGASQPSGMSVWRVKFVPKNGVFVSDLDQAGIKDVIGGEERVGFLPTWYWTQLHEAPCCEESWQDATSSEQYRGWKV